MPVARLGVGTETPAPTSPFQKGMMDYSQFRNRPWRDLFRDPSQMTEKDLEMLIKDFLPPGVSFFGGPAGHGKSWFILSMCKALYLGQPFLGIFAIPKAIPIIYLVPEVGENAMKQRLRALGLGEVKDGFLLHTMSQGMPPALDSPNLRAACRDLSPLVVMDTQARFNRGDDENAAAENKAFVDHTFGLMQHGAVGVVPIHHSIKSLASGEIEPTLENVLRGSGDLGAMADAVYCVLCSDKKNFISEITNVKARDFNPTESFEIQGRPYIAETKDLFLLRAPEDEKEDFDERLMMKIVAILKMNPHKPMNELATELRVRKGKIKALASVGGWQQKGRLWVSSSESKKYKNGSHLSTS
jgi:hypothetical protein